MLLIPERCLLCGAPFFAKNRTSVAICEPCAAALESLDAHVCPQCGLPGDLSGSVCPRCRAQSVSCVSISARYVYRGAAQTLLKTFKKSYNPRLVRFLAAELVPLAKRWSPHPCIVPLPASHSGKRKRGYDQTLALANSLRRLTGASVWNGLRRRRGREQKALTREERQTNLTNAFYLVRSDVPKTIVLLDDVVTTGATLHACADLLQTNGVTKCHGIALARDI